MAKIWFRACMQAEISDEEMKELLIFSGQVNGERNFQKTYEIMNSIIERAELLGETYIVGKDCGGVEDYDNPEKEINFLF